MLAQTLLILLGAGLGYVASVRHERGRERTRLQGVARAIWADLQRIKEEVGPPHDKITEFRLLGSESTPPNIHPWTKSLIPEVAFISPQALLQLFQLERSLHNHGVSLRSFRELVHRLDQEQDALRITKEAVAQEDLGPGWGEQWAAEARQERLVEKVADEVELAEFAAAGDRKRAWDLMAHIEQHLLDFLPSRSRLELVPAANSHSGLVDTATEPPRPAGPA